MKTKSVRRYLALLTTLAALGSPVSAQDKAGQASGERVRGEVAELRGSTLVVKTKDGNTARLDMPEAVVVFTLTKASFTDLDFGSYVGAVSERMGDDIYSPIVRDSLSWLHRGLELRIIDDKLRGIAVGHTKWDLTPQSVMTHGWVDDVEDRVISIKYGPTDIEETDVEIGANTPVTRMSLGEKSALKPGARVVVGAQKNGDGKRLAVFVVVGQDGVVPGL
jgi:hypothetical protein